MKVINVVQDFNVGGIQKLLLEYLRYFKDDKDIDYRVIVLESNKNSLYDKLCREEGLKIHYLNGHISKNKHYYIRQFVLWKSYNYALYKYLKREKPDIVHTHNTRIFIKIKWTIKKLRKKYKWFHTLHSDPYAIADVHIPIVKKMFGDYEIQPICLNKTQFEKAKERYNLTKCSYLLNAFNPTELKRDLKDKNTIKAELNISNNTFVIGAIGRVDPVKNYIFVIDVVAKLKLFTNDFILLIIGDDSGAHELKQKIKALELNKHVMFLGVRNDIGSLINIFDRFVSTSITESASLAVLEAQLFDKYCIVSTAIPKESVCLNNRVVRLNLNDSSDVWVEEILNPSKFEIPSSCLNDYYIESTSKKMMEIYCTSN